MYKLIFSLLLTIICQTTALAQKDLSIGKILDGRYRRNAAVTDVVIMGERLEDFSLTYYHSFTVKDDAQLMKEVSEAFDADQKNAVDKELTNIGGRLYTGLLRMKHNGDTNRFIFYKDMRLSTTRRQNSVIVIYMEGNTSLKSLQKQFKK